MIVDSSAVVAVVFREPGFEVVLDKLARAREAGIGAPTLVETAIVTTARLRSDARGLLARLLQEFEIAVVPFTETHFGAAVDAWVRFGKGRHPARLNFGDCLAYAVARLANRPLLYTGRDFARTDIAAA